MVEEVKITVPQQCAAEADGKIRQLIDLARICASQVAAGANDVDLVKWLQSEGLSVNLAEWLFAQAKYHGEKLVLVMPEIWVSNEGEYASANGSRIPVKLFDAIRRRAGLQVRLIGVCLYLAGCFAASLVVKTWPEILIGGFFLAIGVARVWLWFSRL